MPVVHERVIPHAELQAAAYAQEGLPVISVKDLYYSYPDGNAALRGVNLCIQRGEKVALVGPNGAGKSTLMLTLIGILQGEGQLEIEGLPLSKGYLRTIRAKIGLVFQNPDDQLFSPTVFEDVAFGPLHMGLGDEEVHRRVNQALEQVGMSKYPSRLSHHLSMGEKKRIAIATVLAMEPGILVLDEPTNGLDPRARRSLIRLLEGLNLSILVATHDLRLVQELFPRILIMDEGRIVADGSTSKLLQDVDLLEAHGLEKP